MLTFMALALLVGGVFWFIRWFNDVKIPEPIPEKFKVKILDAAIRFFKAVANLLVTLGLTKPLSPFIRSLGEHWIIFQCTGWPWWKYRGQGLKVKDELIDGVHCRIFEPTSTLNEKDRPVFVYIHGGAFSWLSADVYSQYTSNIAEQAEIVVISINYRLAPEHTFPIPRSDCEAVVRYVLDHGPDMGLDPSRVAIGGDSAGGNLTASLVLQFQDRIKLQLPLVPALQPLDTLTPSNVENEAYMGKSIHSRMTFGCYLSYGGLNPDLLPFLLINNHVSPEVKATVQAVKVDCNTLVVPEAIRTPELRNRKLVTNFGDEAVWDQLKDVFMNPYFSPLLADEAVLAKVPPAYIMTAGYDIIRDDGVMYYSRLRQLGVKAVLKNYEEGFHNSLLYHDGPLKLEVGVRMLKDIVDYLRLNL